MQIIFTCKDLLKLYFSGGVNKVKCIAKNSIPAPSFEWTVGDNIIEQEIENIFDEEEKIFTQILHFYPSLEHANKTLKCTVQHPGLTKVISAATEVKISGERMVQMGGIGVTTIAAIVIVVVLVIIALVAGVIVRTVRKGNKLNKQADEEAAPEEEKVDNNGEGNTKLESLVDTKDETKTDVDAVEEKKGLELKNKLVKILVSMKGKDKKQTDDVAATEFEKVDLNAEAEDKEEEEKKDAEKETEQVNSSFSAKFASILSKFKSTEKKLDDSVEVVEVKPTEEVKLEPEAEDSENSEGKIPERRRRGSETPV